MIEEAPGATKNAQKWPKLGVSNPGYHPRLINQEKRYINTPSAAHPRTRAWRQRFVLEYGHR